MICRMTYECKCMVRDTIESCPSKASTFRQNAAAVRHTSHINAHCISLPFFSFMTTTVIDFCTPPVPGEHHKYYGDAHNKFIKLPQLAVQSSPITTPAPVTTRGTESNAEISNNSTLSPRSSPQPTETTTHGKKIEQQKTLHSLASTGNLAIFKQVLQLLPDPLKAVNDPHPSTGLTPIHFAASRGHVDIVRCLVEDYHVSVDSRDKEGEVHRQFDTFEG